MENKTKINTSAAAGDAATTSSHDSTHFNLADGDRKVTGKCGRGKLQPVIVGIGELLWDVLPSGKRAGGAPVNVVYHAGRLGAIGCAISAVGKDALGDELLRVMDNNSINYIVPRVAYPTGTVQVKLNEGTPTYDIVENVAWDFIPETNGAKAMIADADAIAYGTLASRNSVSRDTICHLLSSASEDTLKYYDINLRQSYYSKDLIVKMLEISNILKINDDELEIIRSMFGLDSMDDNSLAKWFMDKYHLKYFILTAGSRYSTIYSDSEVSTIKTPKVEVVDSVGAGDSFSGAFLYSILSGASLVEAHKKAVEIGAFVCEHAGAWPKYQ